MRLVPAGAGALLRALAAVVGAAGVATGLAGPAAGSLVVCNGTLELLNVALGRADAEGFRTEGWWVVPAGTCAEVVRTPLTERYFYLHAVDVRGEPVFAGDTPMCVGTGSFLIPGADECWLRGFDRAGFREIDTFAARRFTVFVSPD